MTHIAELERKVARRLVRERDLHGDYRSLQDFVNRNDISREQLEILIRIGAFRFSGMNKYALMWEKNAVHNPQIKAHHLSTMFEPEAEEYDLPILEEGDHEQAFDEIELLGFPLCSPFELIDSDIEGDILTADLLPNLGRRVTMLGYFVTRKNVTTVNRKLMNFGTWIDKKGQFFDTTHSPPSLAKFPFKGKGCYLIYGTVVEDFGFPSLEVQKMEKLPYVKDDRY